jgi:predicted nucleic acid-binding protein
VAESGHAYSLDTRALVKLYHQELGSEIMEGWAATPSVQLWVSDLARVELHAVFSRKVQEGELAEAALQRVLERFREDLRHRFQLVPLTPGLIERAICSGQVKTDTQLSNIGYPLEVIGTDIPERRVQPRAIVEHLDVIDHIIPRFLTRGIVTQSRALPL